MEKAGESGGGKETEETMKRTLSAFWMCFRDKIIILLLICICMTGIAWLLSAPAKTWEEIFPEETQQSLYKAGEEGYYPLQKSLEIQEGCWEETFSYRLSRRIMPVIWFGLIDFWALLILRKKMDQKNSSGRLTLQRLPAGKKTVLWCRILSGVVCMLVIRAVCSLMIYLSVRRALTSMPDTSGTLLETFVRPFPESIGQIIRSNSRFLFFIPLTETSIRGILIRNIVYVGAFGVTTAWIEDYAENGQGYLPGESMIYFFIVLLGLPTMRALESGCSYYEPFTLKRYLRIAYEEPFPRFFYAAVMLIILGLTILGYRRMQKSAEEE